ncbi:Cysteine-rich domain protein [Candidatus Desulfosporosinus infrequens]|uniref:Cysteine-rich domain protein n=1 Tax=Candidatus Desulfosporosinus infrequens TaxID=2043169 RepID=A0A2U3L0Y3_9FIRM|nr:Cysteine-rich domain protein [Candidatus Desulfosporosinus infrequens]
MIVIFFFLLILSFGFFSTEVYRRYSFTQLGKPENRSDRPRERWNYFCTQVFLHKKIRDYPFFGIFHTFIMWGFVVLLLSSLDMAVEVLFHVHIPLTGDNLYLFIRDTFIVLVFIGVIGCILRRLIKKPKWLNNSIMTFAILVWILVIVVSELLFYATQATLGGSGSLSWGAWLVAATSRFLINRNMNPGYTTIEVLWWIHFVAIFTFLFIIPRSKHLHLVFAAFNTYWHSLEPKGALLPIKLDEDNQQTYGVSKLEDFTWKQLFDTFSCVKCGRCNGSCPSFQSGELLKPKKLNGRLRKQIEQQVSLLKKYKARQPVKKERTGISKNKLDPSTNKLGNDAERKILKKKIVGGIFEEDFIWNCTTCGGCVNACPVSVEHISKIIDLRRYIVSSGEKISPEVKRVFEGIENYGNPLGIRPELKKRLAWASDLGIPTLAEKPNAEYLYFVGCMPSYDKTAQKVAIAFAKILTRVGTNFAILGDDEGCCGETARRLGNERLFQKTVKRNISSWQNYGIKKILTTCPHCFNTLQNEYFQFGGNYNVIPHSVFLVGLLHSGKLKPLEQNKRVTYHDPCYLGRYNGFYNEPRQILKAIPGVSLVEMPRTRENSFCCGAGGGRFWMKTKSENPISNNRAKEALATGAEVICTACPYCQNVLQEEIQQTDQNQARCTMDIVEILEANL